MNGSVFAAIAIVSLGLWLSISMQDWGWLLAGLAVSVAWIVALGGGKR